MASQGSMSTIESMLEQRPLAPIVLDVMSDDALETVPGPGHVGERMQMTVEEGVRVHTDVFGRKPTAVEVKEERISALAREIGRIPPERRRSLQNALKRYPLLLDSSPHAKMLVQSEDFDAEVAARRMVKYWQQREAMFGNRAFSDGVFTEPTYDDYCKYYERCSRAILDPELDDDAKEIALSHITSVNRAKIIALDQAIAAATAKEKSAFCEAQTRAPDIVGTEEEKLLFLASEDFIEAKAASRLMMYYEYKRALFGPSLFHKKIMLADVQNDSLKFAQHLIRLSPGADQHGRTMMTLFPQVLEGGGWTKEDILKFLWYVMERAMQRESTRKNGLVVMLDYRSMTKDLSDKITPVRTLMRSMVTDCFPLKLRVLHIYMGQHKQWKSVLASFFFAFAILFKKRVVIHTGSTDKYQSELEVKFGISSDLMPQELGGEYDKDAWETWVRSETERSP